MKKYKAIVDGVERFFSVPAEEYDGFMIKYPDAILVEDTEKEGPTQKKEDIIGKPGFQTDPVESADAESEITAQQAEVDNLTQQADVEISEGMESKSESGSVESLEPLKGDDLAVLEGAGDITAENNSAKIEIEEIAIGIREESLESINKEFGNLPMTDWGTKDYTNVDIPSIRSKAKIDFISNNKEIQDTILPSINVEIEDALPVEIARVKMKYGLHDEAGYTQKNIDKADKELSEWYNKELNNRADANPRFNKLLTAFESNVSKVLDKDFEIMGYGVINYQEGWDVVFEIIEQKRMLLFWKRESVIITLSRPI
jgi:hypothetical protein